MPAAFDRSSIKEEFFSQHREAICNLSLLEFHPRRRKLGRDCSSGEKHFSYEALAKATNNFHHDHKLGESGFGPVYKGKLDDGREIAVKKLSRSSRQGKNEFQNEAVE